MPCDKVKAALLNLIQTVQGQKYDEMDLHTIHRRINKPKEHKGGDWQTCNLELCFGKGYFDSLKVLVSIDNEQVNERISTEVDTEEAVNAYMEGRAPTGFYDKPMGVNLESKPKVVE